MFKKLFTDKESLKIMIIGVQFIACLIIFHFVSAPSPIELCVYAALYLAAGYECIIGAFKKFLKKPFNEKMLMVVASVGSFVLGCYEEAVAVMLLYALGEYIEDLAHERSRNSITALMEAIPKTAHVLRDAASRKADARYGRGHRPVVGRCGRSQPKACPARRIRKASSLRVRPSSKKYAPENRARRNSSRRTKKRLEP